MADYVHVIKNQAAFDTGQLAERLAAGYFTHTAAILVAIDPRSDLLAPERLPGENVSIGIVKDKCGDEHRYFFQHYLNLARYDPIITSELERIWLTGSILRLGDVLSKNNYFDRAPELELLRHIRNGIAHGNRFRIDKPENLNKFPAHNKQAWTNNKKMLFEITPDLQGKSVLFDFMAAGDIITLLQTIGLYLVRMGNGDPLRP